MPKYTFDQLGVTKDQAKSIFTGLSREEAMAKAEELVSQRAQGQENVGTFTEKVNALNEVKNDPYKSMAVGANALSVDKGGFAGAIYKLAHPIKNIKNAITGGKQGVIADIENITSKETLDNLIAIKAAGGTFGALSEKELQMLIDSATKVGRWKKEDDNGNVYYDVGEKIFDDELDRLTKLANKAIVKSGGSPVGGNLGQTSNGIKYEIVQ